MLNLKKGGARGLTLATGMGMYPTLSHSLLGSDHLLFNMNIPLAPSVNILFEGSLGST